MNFILILGAICLALSAAGAFLVYSGKLKNS